MKSRLSTVMFTAAALFAGVSLSAQEQLVNYDFTTNISSSSWNATLLTGDPGNLIFANGSGGTRSSSLGGNTFARARESYMGGTQATASKFTFTLTPLQSLQLGQITFDIGSQNSGNSPSYTLNYQVGVKIGSAAEVLLPTVATYNVIASNASGYVSNPAVNTAATFDLGSFTDVSSSVSFGIYIYVTNRGGEFAFTDNNTARLDNIAVTTAIPEPRTAALAGGLGALCLVLLRRRGIGRA